MKLMFKQKEIKTDDFDFLETGTTLLIKDDDGEQWVAMKCDNDFFVVVAYNNDGYNLGETFDVEDLKRHFEEYGSEFSNVNGEVIIYV